MMTSEVIYQGKVRLQTIDETSIDDHWYITADDECHYLGVYTSGTSYSYSEVNSIISNFKKKPSSTPASVYKWKVVDIKKVAEYFRKAVNPAFVSEVTFVPVPPSKAKDHEDYDDRLVQILRLAFPNDDADIRELVEQTVSTVSVHTQAVRPSIKDVKDILAVNEDLLDGVRDRIVIFDDVLTNGTHFCAVRELLKEHFPNAEFIGIFFARRVFPSV